MGYSNTIENEQLNAFITSHGSAIWVALFDGSPLDDGSGGTELTGTGYARIQHSAWTTAANGEINNSSQIDYAIATGAWGDATHFALVSHATAAVSSSNLLAFGEIKPAVVINSGSVPKFAPGALKLIQD